jgi:hypothetical protein
MEPIVISWPEGVAQALGLSTQHLQRLRSLGDSPQLYAVSERVLVTTTTDVLAWVRAKAVPHGYKCRPATIPAGTKRPGTKSRRPKPRRVVDVGDELDA